LQNNREQFGISAKILVEAVKQKKIKTLKHQLF